MAAGFAQRFAEIETAVFRNWDRDDPDHLAGAATHALEQCRDLLSFDPGDCLQWALDEKADLPEQSWSFDFGQPAITVVRNADFRVDLLYWIENASAIHDHVTCGAFAALHGERLHDQYRFEQADPVGPWIGTGSLTKVCLEVMGEGDARPIRPELIHDLFWLGKPSVTMVVRCAEHPGAVTRKPRSYWAPGIALVPKAYHDTSLVSRRVEGLELMRMADESMYRDALARTLEGADASFAYYAFLGAAVGSPEVLDSVLEGLSSPGAVLEHLVRAREQFVRRSHLGGLYTADSASRLLVGLLWAEADVRATRDAIAAVFPDTSVADVVKAGVAALEEVSPETAGPVRELAERAMSTREDGLR